MYDETRASLSPSSSLPVLVSPPPRLSPSSNALNPTPALHPTPNAHPIPGSGPTNLYSIVAKHASQWRQKGPTTVSKEACYPGMGYLVSTNYRRWLKIQVL